MKCIGLYATFVHIQAKLGQENLLLYQRGLYIRLVCILFVLRFHGYKNKVIKTVLMREFTFVMNMINNALALTKLSTTKVVFTAFLKDQITVLGK